MNEKKDPRPSEAPPGTACDRCGARNTTLKNESTFLFCWDRTGCDARKAQRPNDALLEHENDGNEHCRRCKIDLQGPHPLRCPGPRTDNPEPAPTCDNHPGASFDLRCAECFADLTRGRARSETAWPKMPAWASDDIDDETPLPEDDAIKAAFPTRSGRHDLYGEAMRLVGARRSKGGLVSLVNWLLHRAEGQRDQHKATRTGSGAR